MDAAKPRIGGSFVQRVWEQDLSAYGGRKARQVFSYDAFIPVPIAEFNPVLPGTNA